MATENNYKKRQRKTTIEDSLNSFVMSSKVVYTRTDTCYWRSHDVKKPHAQAKLYQPSQETTVFLHEKGVSYIHFNCFLNYSDYQQNIFLQHVQINFSSLFFFFSKCWFYFHKYYFFYFVPYLSCVVNIVPLLKNLPTFYTRQLINYPINYPTLSIAL